MADFENPPSVEPPREMVERCDLWLARYFPKLGDAVPAEWFENLRRDLLAEFTSVRSQAIAEAASLVPKLTREGFGQGVYNEGLCDYAASIRSLR